MKKQTITFTSILLTLGCFAFLSQMQAVSPPPDGCYPGFTTAEGCNALNSLTSGAGNTGVGWYSLFFAGGANYNTGVGAGTLVLNTGDSNTAVGAAASLLNTTGTQNVAVGTDALVFNATGSFNNGVGAFALFNNDSSGSGLANDNNAFGDGALYSNIDGARNCAFGDGALSSSVTTSDNIAFGRFALGNNDSSGNGLANNNTAVGAEALINNIDGDYLTALGANAGTDPDIVRNNIYIGDMGFAGDENVIAIGGIAASGTDYDQFYVGGVVGAELPVATAVPVYIDTENGRLGTMLVNGSGKPAAPRVRRGKAAQPQAMLNRKVEKLQTTTAQQQKQISQQQKQISQQQRQIEVLVSQLKEQAAQIQKVSAQFEMSKAAPKVVTNDQ